MRSPATICWPRVVVALLGVVSASCTTGDSTGDPSAGATTAPAAPGRPVALAEIAVGDCLTNLSFGGSERVMVELVDLTSCRAPHEAEIFDRFEVPPELAGVDYPGQEAVVSAAELACSERVVERRGPGSPAQGGTADQGTGEQGEAGVSVLTIWPTPVSWSEGDRLIACGLLAPPGQPFQEPVIPER